MQPNYEPLNKLVTKKDISDYKTKYEPKMAMNDKIKLRIFYSFLIIYILLVSVFAFNEATKMFSSGVITLQLIIIFTSIAVLIYKITKASNEVTIRNTRLMFFTEANNLEFIATTHNPEYNGMVFHEGTSRCAYNQIRSKSGRLFEIANYRYTIQSGDNHRIISNGYIMIELDRNLPHIVLDSSSNNGIFGTSIGNMSTLFRKGQKLSLEGDFDKYFTLYAPTEYERDALYIFTPDLMALFIDQTNSFDAEIVDNKMYIYSTEEFNLANPVVLERIFKIINTVGSKTISQTDQYHDERVGNRSADIVDINGRRLKGWLSQQAVVIVIVFTVIFISIFRILLER